MQDKFGILCRLSTLLAVTIAVALQVAFVLLDCQLVSYDEGRNGEQFVGLFFETATRRNDDDDEGAFASTFLESKDCVSYDWISQGSGYLRIAQLSSILAILGGVCCFFLIFFETCCVRLRCAPVLDVISFATAMLFSGLIFLIYQDDVCEENGGCFSSRGSAANIGAMVLHGFAILIMCCTPKPQPLLRQLCGPSEKDVKDVDDTASADEFVTVGAGTDKRKRIRRTPSALMREMEEETISLEDIMTVETKRTPSPRRIPRVLNVRPRAESLDDGLTIDSGIETTFKKTPSGIMRELDSEEYSISDLLSVGTSAGPSARRLPAKSMRRSQDGDYEGYGAPNMRHYSRSGAAPLEEVPEALKESSSGSSGQATGIESKSRTSRTSSSIATVPEKNDGYMAEVESNTDGSKESPVPSTVIVTDSEGTGSDTDQPAQRQNETPEDLQTVLAKQEINRELHASPVDVLAPEYEAVNFADLTVVDAVPVDVLTNGSEPEIVVEPQR